MIKNLKDILGNNFCPGQDLPTIDIAGDRKQIQLKLIEVIFLWLLLVTK